MIALLARLLGVDPVHWRALVWVSFTTDVRNIKGTGLRVARAAAGSLGGALLSQLLYGAFCAALIAVLPNVFATSTIYFTLLLTTIGLALLVDFTSVVLSPDDHVQLAPRPVDGRTFFVARLTSVVGFSLMLAAPASRRRGTPARVEAPSSEAPHRETPGPGKHRATVRGANAEGASRTRKGST